MAGYKEKVKFRLWQIRRRAGWFNPLWWVAFRFTGGEASWCGRFWIVYAPVNWSKLLGGGKHGLWLYRWTERGHEIIRADKLDRQRRMKDSARNG